MLSDQEYDDLDEEEDHDDAEACLQCGEHPDDCYCE